MMMRRARVLFLAGALALAVAACPDDDDDNGNGLGTEDDPVELAWAIGGAEAQPGGTHQQVVEMWNEQNPNIQVSIEVLPESADEQRVQQTLVLDAQGTDFDILGMDVIWTGEYSENGWVENLDDLMDEVEGQVLEGPLESAMWGGELWALPYNSNAGILYYRSDLVDEPPTTWEELCEVGQEAGEEEGIAAFVAQGARYEGFVVNFLEYYWSAGGELYNEDQTEVLWPGGDAAQTALEFMEGAFDDGCYAAGFNTAMEEEARSEFQEGNAVFMRNWPYAWELIQEDEDAPVAGNVEIAPLPTFEGEGTISALGGFNNGISAFSENKEAASEFIVWLATDEEVQTFLGERALPPVIEQVYDDLAEDEVMSLLGEVLPDARPRPPAPEWAQISENMQAELFPAYQGDREHEAAISAIEEFLQGTIQ
jgi:multiple sugar transport system substrate-binding protein